MPQISITISAEAVAWYGAVVSAIGFLLSGYIALRDRPRLSISIDPNMRVKNVPSYDPRKTYINITVRNRGRRPVKIQTVYLKLLGAKAAELMLVGDSLLQHDARRVLTEE